MFDSSKAQRKPHSSHLWGFHFVSSWTYTLFSIGILTYANIVFNKTYLYCCIELYSSRLFLYGATSIISFLHFGQQYLSVWWGSNIDDPKWKAYFSFQSGSVLKKCFLSLHITYPLFKYPWSISSLQKGHFIYLTPLSTSSKSL